MTTIATSIRRAVVPLLVVVGAGVALFRRQRPVTPTVGQPPQWPAWPATTRAPATTEKSATTEKPERPDKGWVAPNDDGSAPDGHPIKVKESSGIFHLPGGRFYDRTKADRCYATAAAAQADGYRQSKS